MGQNQVRSKSPRTIRSIASFRLSAHRLPSHVPVYFLNSARFSSPPASGKVWDIRPSGCGWWSRIRQGTHPAPLWISAFFAVPSETCQKSAEITVLGDGTPLLIIRRIFIGGLFQRNFVDDSGGQCMDILAGTISFQHFFVFAIERADVQFNLGKAQRQQNFILRSGDEVADTHIIRTSSGRFFWQCFFSRINASSSSASCFFAAWLTFGSFRQSNRYFLKAAVLAFAPMEISWWWRRYPSETGSVFPPLPWHSLP